MATLGSQIRKAESLGAWGAEPETLFLWKLPKRTLVEMVLRLAASSTDSCDEFDLAVDRAKDELTALALNDLI